MALRSMRTAGNLVLPLLTEPCLSLRQEVVKYLGTCALSQEAYFSRKKEANSSKVPPEEFTVM